MIGERPNQTPANGVEAAAIAYQALELRKRGASYRTIATKLSCSVSTAHGHVTTALAELRERTKTSAEELRELEIQRLDRWEAALQMGLREPEGPNRAKVVATLVKVAESRRKLLGLDAPQRIEHSGNLYTVKEASPDCEAWGQPAAKVEQKEGADDGRSNENGS